MKLIHIYYSINTDRVHPDGINGNWHLQMILFQFTPIKNSIIYSNDGFYRKEMWSWVDDTARNEAFQEILSASLQLSALQPIVTYTKAYVL